MIDRIRDTYRPGDTLGTLAARLGVSRSTISGYYHRKPVLRETHPLGGHNPGIKNTSKHDSVRSRRERGELPPKPRKRTEQPATTAQDIPRPRAIDIDNGVTGRYTLLDLPSGCCKWPFGGPGTHTFCGSPVTGGSKQFRMYCTEHAYRARDKRVRDNCTGQSNTR